MKLNGLELSCPAESGCVTRILGPDGGQDKYLYKGPVRLVSFSELLGGKGLTPQSDLSAIRLKPPMKWL